MTFDDRTQMTPPQDDPNKARVEGLDTNATQLGGPMPLDMNRTAMATSMRAITLDCVPENSYALATQATREHVLVKITGSGTVMGARMPLNLCLILDRSGSMEGPPMEYMKRACGYVVDLLEPGDVLSIVAFADQAEVIMPARRVVNKQLIKEHINRLDVGNTTDLFGGISMGAAQIASVASPGYINRALLFTDGEPTAGNKDFSSIVGNVVEQKSRGITFTALGFGSEYNEELLAAIAKRSGGNYYYIMRPELIPEIFRKELETMMMAIARNVRMRVQMSRWVQVRQIYNKLPTYGNRWAEVTLADLERGEVQTAIVELELGPRPGGKYRVARIDIIYDDSVTGRTETVSGDVVVEFTTDASLIASGLNPEVQRELAIAQASMNLERTVMGMRTQMVSPDEAVRELEKTQALLIQQGKTLQAQDIQCAIDQIKQGAAAEKTLIGINLDREKMQ
ncbi:MAG: VWA domain-containing protein [Armatimonadetes bacterium]|nr:VWA domain-containing protein [Armatimonadota bacterium]